MSKEIVVQYHIYQVYIAGDEVPARDMVTRVVRGAGFTPVDLGCLVYMYTTPCVLLSF